MLSSHIKDVLRIARTKNNIDCILLNIEDYYGLLDSQAFGRIDPVTDKSLQNKMGLYGHIDGFSVYCSKDCPSGQFALAQDNTANSLQNIKDLKWTEYATYYSNSYFPRVGQRYCKTQTTDCVIEIISIDYKNNKYPYDFLVEIVQLSHSNSLFSVGSLLKLNTLDGYQYLPGQDKPIA